MEITVAKTAGFCGGVSRAVEMARRAAADSKSADGNGCSTIGPLIHNDDMIAQLEAEGVRVAGSVGEALGGTVVIPSHGSPPEAYEKARELGLALVDATCPFVSRLRQEALTFDSEGGRVVLVGDPGHPEVKAVASYLRDPVVSEDAGTIIESMRRDPERRYLILSQTTAIPKAFERVCRQIRAAGFDPQVVETICTATANRQAEARRISAEADAVIVLGGSRSANTNRLEQIARESGKPVYRAANLKGLDTASIRTAGYKRIGITAGASTPNSIIEEVYKAMIENGEEKELTMAELEKLYPEKKEEVREAPRKSELQIVKGRVTLVTDEEVLADVGQGSDVHIPKNQLTFSKSVSPAKMFKEGDEIAVALEEFDSSKDVQYASKVKADEVLAWQRVKDAFESGTPVEGIIVEAVKGGVVVDAGIRGFMPASQIGSRNEDLSVLIGTKVKAKVIELEESRKGAVLSQRALHDEQNAKLRLEGMDKVQPGAVFEGKVRKLMPFGAFVSVLPGIDGLVHVSEISWQRVENPSDVLTEGMSVNVKVLSVDTATKKISLSMKQLEEKPRSTSVRPDLTEGEVYKGTVVKLTGFGAFVKLDNGAEGLVHVSQISDKRIQSPDEVLSVGQEVKVKVLSVDPEKNRISLSIRDAELKEQRDQFEGYMKSAGEDFTITIADRIRLKGDKKR